jgi:acyl carrier protein
MKKPPETSITNNLKQIYTMSAQELKVKEILQKKFFVSAPPHMAKVSLSHLGLSQLDLNELINHLEEEFKIEYENEINADHLSLHELVVITRNKLNN